MIKKKKKKKIQNTFFGNKNICKYIYNSNDALIISLKIRLVDKNRRIVTALITTVKTRHIAPQYYIKNATIVF